MKIFNSVPEYPVKMYFYILSVYLIGLVNLSQGVTIVPSTFIQGQSASITCTDATVVVLIDLNDRTIIDCILSQPVCNIRDEEDLDKYRDNYNVTHNSTSLTITITNVSRNRVSGVWECSTIGDDRTNYTVDVKVPVPTVSIPNIQSKTLTHGQTTSITCKTGVSYPPANITWSIGGTNINGATTTNNPDGTTTSILQYTPDRTDHNKILQCSATNGYGSTKSVSVSLNIRFSPSVQIVPTARRHDVIQGRQLLLVCIARSSNPEVTCTDFTWSKDGLAIPGQRSSVYRVESVERSHTGSYTCTGDNGVGTGTSTPVQVDVVSNSTQSTTQSTIETEKGDGGDGFIKGLGTGVGITLAVVFMVVLSIYFYNKYKTSPCQQNKDKDTEHYSDLSPRSAELQPPTYQELHEVNTTSSSPSSSLPSPSSSSTSAHHPTPSSSSTSAHHPTPSSSSTSAHHPTPSSSSTSAQPPREDSIHTTENPYVN